MKYSVCRVVVISVTLPRVSRRVLSVKSGVGVALGAGVGVSVGSGVVVGVAVSGVGVAVTAGSGVGDGLGMAAAASGDPQAASASVARSRVMRDMGFLSMRVSPSPRRDNVAPPLSHKGRGASFQPQYRFSSRGSLGPQTWPPGVWRHR